MKKYINPKIEITLFGIVDIITVSGDPEDVAEDIDWK